MDRSVVVSDPEFGTIAGVIDADGFVLSTDAVDRPRPNITRYATAADYAAREEAELFAAAHPELAWIARRFWDDCIAEGGAR
jgi:hypothetical protein